MGIVDWKYTGNWRFGRVYKWCSFCGKYKLPQSFVGLKSSKDGRAKVCKKCHCRHVRRWMKRNPERCKAIWRARDKRSVDTKYKDYFRAIDDLVELGKGRRDDAWFFKMFPNKWKYKYMPDTLDGIQECLYNAWWIEEEDIRQHLLISTWSTKITSMSGYHNTYYFLAHHLRDYLLNQRVFSRYSGWEEHYQYHFEHVICREEEYTEASLSLLFNNFEGTPLQYLDTCLFNKYVLYLLYIAGETCSVIGERILYTLRPTMFIMSDLKQQLEEHNAKAKITGGYSIPIFARREVYQ